MNTTMSAKKPQNSRRSIDIPAAILGICLVLASVIYEYHAAHFWLPWVQWSLEHQVSQQIASNFTEHTQIKGKIEDCSDATVTVKLDRGSPGDNVLGFAYAVNSKHVIIVNQIYLYRQPDGSYQNPVFAVPDGPLVNVVVQ